MANSKLLKDIQTLAREFEDQRKLLVALGDENRQDLLVSMMKMGRCEGACVADIAEQSRLSRPAVSHHLQILKEAGLLKVRHEGTKNFYYFDAKQASIKGLIETLEHARTLAAAVQRA